MQGNFFSVKVFSFFGGDRGGKGAGRRERGWDEGGERRPGCPEARYDSWQAVSR